MNAFKHIVKRFLRAYELESGENLTLFCYIESGTI